EVAAWEHSEPSLQRHLTRMEEAAEDAVLATDTLKAGGDPEVLFPARTSPMCSYCDFRRSCPQGRAAAPDAQPWSLLAPGARGRPGRVGYGGGRAPSRGWSGPAWWCSPPR